MNAGLGSMVEINAVEPGNREGEDQLEEAEYQADDGTGDAA